MRLRITIFRLGARDDDLQAAIIYLLSCDLYLAGKPLTLPLSRTRINIHCAFNFVGLFYNVALYFEMLYRFCSFVAMLLVST